MSSRDAAQQRSVGSFIVQKVAPRVKAPTRWAGVAELGSGLNSVDG